MLEATLAHGVSRQTIMHRVKTGQLKAVHLRTGRRKACVSNPPPHKKDCSNHDNQRTQQYVDPSNAADRSASTIHTH